MVNNSTAPDSVLRDPHLDTVFGALADPTRRQMIARLSRGVATVGELGEPFDMTKGAVTKHVKVLERAGLLKRDVRGRTHYCEFQSDPLDTAQRWVEQVRAFWEERFDELALYLHEMQAGQQGREEES